MMSSLAKYMRDSSSNLDFDQDEGIFTDNQFMPKNKFNDKYDGNLLDDDDEPKHQIKSYKSRDNFESSS